VPAIWHTEHRHIDDLKIPRVISRDWKIFRRLPMGGSMRQFTTRLLGSLFLGFLSVAASADVQYTVTPITGLGGVGTVGTGLNDQGQVVGYSGLSDGSTHAFLFDGQIHDLGTFGGANSYAYGINNFGDMAIFNIVKNPDNTYTRTGFRYESGVAHSLGPIDDNIYVNNARQYAYEQVVNGESHAFLYSNGVAQDLSSYGNNHTTFSWGISDAGDVIVESEPQWLIYRDNSVTNIADPAATRFTIARAVNSAGDVAGVHGVAVGTRERAFVYHNGTYTDLPLLAAGSGNEAYGIGSNGWVLGEADLPAEGGGWYLEASIFHDGQVFDLNSLISPSDAQKYHLTEGIAMNSSGQILVDNGALPFGSDSSEAFLLTPISATPEPTGLGVIFALGMPLLLRRRRGDSWNRGDLLFGGGGE
jgi:probable HAF family extracellular repeat protein